MPTPLARKPGLQGLRHPATSQNAWKTSIDIVDLILFIAHRVMHTDERAAI
jgi:hypothetical protein